MEHREETLYDKTYPSPSKDYVKDKVKRPFDDFTGAFKWTKKTINVPDVNTKGNKPLVKVDIYDSKQANLDKMTTGNLGEYKNSEEMGDLIARPRLVGDGRYAANKDVKYEDE